MKEDYVSIEIAKLLKEKGFNIPTHTFYNPKKSYMVKFDPCLIDRNAGTCVSAPTIQMAMKWLREKCIIITIKYMRYSLQTIGSQMMFGFNIQNTQGELLSENIDTAYDSCEQAEMDAIKYTLENLV